MVANRFKKSIESATGNTQENIIVNASENIVDNTLDDISKNIVVNTSDNATEKTIEKQVVEQVDVPPKANSDILKKILENEKKDKGGNHTIYLSAEVGDALVKLAKKNKKSKSALVDEILREVLLN